jgi:hypothetical protein
MKALVVLVHYFAAEAAPQHASVDAKRQTERARAVEQVVRGYRGAFGPPSTLRFRSEDYHLNSALGPEVDLRVLTVPGHSLLQEPFRRRFGVDQTLAQPANPRMLGFNVYRIFAKMADRYDWFVYSEDDLLVRDPLLFTKLNWFNRVFGDRRVLQPNRFEWNDRAKTQKTYIDGDVTSATRERLFAPIEDADFLSTTVMSAQFGFRRARNPHSGFFAVTAAQLAHWMSQPHWLDEDTSFYTPLESAATLGLTKTFSVYKPFGPSAGFLEIEHLDNRFSSRKGFPLTRRKAPSEAQS